MLEISFFLYFAVLLSRTLLNQYFFSEAGLVDGDSDSGCGSDSAQKYKEKLKNSLNLSYFPSGLRQFKMNKKAEIHAEIVTQIQ